MSELRVLYIRPVLATRDRGIKIGQATFSDGLTARFRVLSRNPPAVHVVGGEATPARERAVIEWLAAQCGSAVA